jgi:colanic acid/amylovoran biosynthesis glycosyltransferase
MGCYNLNLKRSLELPMVTTFYGIDLSLYALTGWDVRYRPLFREGECFLVEGSHMKKCLQELGCPEDKIRIVHIGADTDLFKYKERQVKERGKSTLLFCGRLIEKKGLEYALRALASIKDKCSNVELRVIGDGPLRDRLIGLVEELELENVVKLLGYVPYEQTKKEMDNAHILVQPSVTATNGETEGGAPTVLIEAQACGMPILASLHADIPEVVLDGKSGLLSEERNFEQLAEHMVFLLEHPEKWPEMGLAGRRHVEENYNIKTEAQKIEQIYAELIGDSSEVLGSKV